MWWKISELPVTCPCGSRCDTQHSMICKKGGFVTIRHNDLRDLTAKILSEVCYDTEIEPKLVPLRGEDLSHRTANRSNEARIDVRAPGFWERGQQAFFDLRVVVKALDSQSRGPVFKTAGWLQGRLSLSSSRGR